MFYSERSGFVRAIVAGSTAAGRALRVAEKKRANWQRKQLGRENSLPNYVIRYL